MYRSQCANRKRLRDMQCNEQRMPVVVPGPGGKWEKKADKVTYKCTARYTCSREKCEVPEGGDRAVKQ